jgi:hypothetical protein
MIKHMFLNLDLKALRLHLADAEAIASREIARIQLEEETGSFVHFEDAENAFYELNLRLQLALRSVYYELASMIEGAVQSAAEPAWLASSRHRGPKSFYELGPDPKKHVRRLRLVSDLHYGELVWLINQHYGMDLYALDGGAAAKEVCEVVNAFKHRRGREDFRKREPPDLTEPPRRHELQIAAVRETIDQVGRFLKALSAVVEHARQGHMPSN